MSLIELPWVEKYRPNRIDDVIGHANLVNTLRKFAASGGIPHLLLHGPPGTGKTTIMKALTHEIYGNNTKSMVLTLNASDERGIDVVRNVIKEFASSSKMRSENVDYIAAAAMKVVILDEADQMTTAAQMSLRRIIEIYSSTVRFCILCNYINKINPAIQSRCTKFRVPPLSMDVTIPRLMYICQQEDINMDEDAMKALYRISQGDMRRLVNMLQSIGLIGERDKDANEVFKDLGYPDPETINKLKTTCLERSFEEIFDAIIQLQVDRGLLLSDIVIALYEEMVSYGDWPLPAIGLVITKLADLLHHLAKGTSYIVMSGAVASIMIEFRYVLEKMQENQTT